MVLRYHTPGKTLTKPTCAYLTKRRVFIKIVKDNHFILCAYKIYMQRAHDSSTYLDWPICPCRLIYCLCCHAPKLQQLVQTVVGTGPTVVLYCCWANCNTNIIEQVTTIGRFIYGCVPFAAMNLQRLATYRWMQNNNNNKDL